MEERLGLVANYNDIGSELCIVGYGTIENSITCD